MISPAALPKAFIATLLSFATATAENRYHEEILPILENACYECHGEGSAKGEFSADTFKDLASHLNDIEHWTAVWRNVQSQIMPPSEGEPLTPKDRKTLLSWIQSDVFKLDPKNPDPGKVIIRRLNRTEYSNAVYDLLGVEFDTTEVFPPDDTGYGFDTIGEVLSISPLLMEKYIAAAETVVSRALPSGAAAQVPRIDINGTNFKSPSDESISGSWLPFKTPQKIQATAEIQWPGEYKVILEYAVRGATDATTQSAEFALLAGSNVIGKELVAWDSQNTIQFIGKTKLKKGKSPFELSLTPLDEPEKGEEEQSLVIQRLILKGPLDGNQREYAKGYRMIFVDGEAPKNSTARKRYARKIMKSFVSRAFRRPLDTQTIDRLLHIIEEVDARPGKNFKDGIKEAIATCLCSPRFLFRIELQHGQNSPGAKSLPIDEYALATRLSFFLWRSIPDDELLSLAFNKELRKNLPAQVERMLADSRASRMTSDFTGQWLQVNNLQSAPVNPQSILGLNSKREASLAFDVRLRDDMQRETELLFEHLLKSESPIEELISADYSFLNSRLAEFYGIKGISGDSFRQVDLSKHPERGGVLTHGSYLIVSSNPTRTSPVKRGLYVLENLLGTPPPPAPPDIPELEEAASETNTSTPTMRQMMEIHRKKRECASCHARMDPIGLGLENFNALGQFREKEAGAPIDAAGELITGEKFSSPAELKKILATERRSDFYRCLSEKLLTYAIGRGIEYYDATTIDQLVARLESSNGNLRQLIHSITESAPFQKRRNDNN